MKADHGCVAVPTFCKDGQAVFVRIICVALALVRCSGSPSEAPRLRADRDVLRAMLASDDRTMQAMDPVLGTLGTGHGGAEASARLAGPISGLARDAARRARKNSVSTEQGRRIRARIVAGLEERERVVELYVKAAKSGRPEELLAAVREQRALEEEMIELDLKVEALPSASR